MTSDANTHKKWMRQALGLARRGWGRTSPNPMVGAVVVKAGKLLGSGWHREAGGPHAEVAALAAAGEAARGADLVVNLEPCSTTGRTGPCTDAIAAAGIARVIFGTRDPNPNHDGAAAEILARHGIEVVEGIDEATCRQLNEVFFHCLRVHRPFVMLKLAMTLDGRIATPGGDSQWITGEAARRKVQKMRQWADAILVGAETVRRDDPQLIVRSPANWRRQPVRYVCTRSEDLGASPKIMNDGLSSTYLVRCDSADEWRGWLRFVAAQHGIQALLVEGGGVLAADMLAAGMIDKVAFFYAPKLMGGTDSRAAIGGDGPASLSESLDITDLTVTRCGADILCEGYVVRKG